MPSKDIFSSLAKYASASEENYLTEAFVFLMNSLLGRERPAGIELLNHLCFNNDDYSFGVDEVISVSTQVTTKQGTPDIEVSSPDKLIYIEVKDQSDIRPSQLRHYKKELASASFTFRRLILLTRFSADFNEHQGIPDKHIRWFEVYNWLTKARDNINDLVIVYLIESFISFLEAKHMSIQQVGWEYGNGINAMNNLMTMIESAIQGTAIKVDWKAAGWNFRGLMLGGGEFWCGIYFNNPLIMIFQMRKKRNFNTNLMKKPTYELREGRERMWFRLPLVDEHFFSLDKDEQLELIRKFVITSHAEAQKMRIKEK